MSKSRVIKEKRKKQSVFTFIFLYIIGWALGYYLLNHVSKLEKPVLGNTFHIVAGCALIAIFSILILFTLQKKFFPKKSRKIKSRRQVFLKDVRKREEN